MSSFTNNESSKKTPNDKLNQLSFTNQSGKLVDNEKLNQLSFSSNSSFTKTQNEKMNQLSFSSNKSSRPPTTSFTDHNEKMNQPTNITSTAISTPQITEKINQISFSTAKQGPNISDKMSSTQQNFNNNQPLIAPINEKISQLSFATKGNEKDNNNEKMNNLSFLATARPKENEKVVSTPSVSFSRSKNDGNTRVIIGSGSSNYKTIKSNEKHIVSSESSKKMYEISKHIASINSSAKLFSVGEKVLIKESIQGFNYDNGEVKVLYSKVFHKSGRDSSNLLVDAIAIDKGGNEKFIMLDTKAAGDKTFDIDSYGEKVIKLYGDNSEKVLWSNPVKISPEQSVLPRRYYEFYDCTNNEKILSTGEVIISVKEDPRAQSGNFTKSEISMMFKETFVFPQDLEDAVYVMTFKFPNYAAKNIKIVKIGDSIAKDDTYKCLISRSITDGKSRAILSWSNNPRDLDLHLFASNGEHIYFGSRKGKNMFLDHDVTNGLGPETATFTIENNVRYRFCIHNYSGEAPLYSSQARVFFTSQGENESFELLVPTDPHNHDLRWWDCFEISADKVQIINAVTSNRPKL